MAVYLPSDGNWHEVASRSITVNGNIYITGKVFAKCWGESVANNTHYLQTKQVVYRSGYSCAGSGYSFECSYCATNSGSGVWTFESEEQVNGDSATQTITHNADGTKTLNLYGFYYNKYWGISEWYSADVQLPTIPRASTPSIPSASAAKELGNAITISISRAANGFKHTLRIKDGNDIIETVGTAQAVDTSQSWTPTIATYAPRIINGETKTFTIECLTYNGSTHIGTKTCNVILKVPASQKPSVTISIAEANPIVPSSWGKYVKGISKLTVTLNETLSYTAPITNRSITVEGSTYSTNPATTNALTASGNVTATITDSRGHASSTATKAYTVEDYAPPQITSAMIIRCNSNGADNPDGDYMKYTFAASISPVANKNTKSFKIQYKKRTSAGQTEDTWHDYYTYNGGYTVDQQSVVGNTQLSSAYTYDIKFIVEDQFNTTVVTKVLDTAFDLMNFHRSGRSMAIGKMSEAQDSDKRLEIQMDNIDLTGNVTVNGNPIESLPIGTILPYSSTTIPSGYMLCNGSAISRVDYADLFAVLGTTYGNGDGSTTFNIPDLRNKFILGNGTGHNIGTSGGAETVTLETTQIPSHTHTQKSCTNPGNHAHNTWNIFSFKHSSGGVTTTCTGEPGDGRGNATDGNGGHTHTITLNNTGGGQAHENMPPYLTMVYMIKVAAGNATIPGSVTISNADVAQITTNKNDITSLKSKTNHIGEYIVLRRNTDLTWYASGQTKDKFQFTQVYSSSGTGLSAYDNNQRVKVNAGVSAIRVTYHLNKNEEDFSSNWIMGYIYKNNTPLKRSITKADKWAQLDDTMIIPVQQGDIIGVYVQTDRSGNITFPTYDSFASCGGMQILNVEVVK